MPVILEANAEPIPGYRLIERLGQGGFGEVWSAEAPGGLRKAVKVVFGAVPFGKSSTEGKADRELKGLSRIRDLRHPFILSLDRFEIVDGRLVIVMELADRDLADRLREYRKQGLPGIPRAELLKYMSEAAEALDFMNFDHDVQHLDVKPSNLFLVQNHVKVADFGLAKDLEGVSASMTGGMTPVYASPETFQGKISRNTDQYSLAIVYQELLTGQLPFPGPSAQQFLMQHMTKEPLLAPLPEMDRPIVRRALSKDPTQRFRTCREFVDALRNANSDDAIVIGRPLDRKSVRIEKTSPHSSVGDDDQLASSTIVGIDLGTTNSVVAVFEGTEAKVIPDAEGNRLTPSVVAFTARGERLVGAPAKRQAATNPNRTIASIKRFMGRRMSEAQSALRLVPYEVVGETNELVRVRIDGKDHAPPEISAMILRKLKESAEEYLGTEVRQAVVTVPAYFNDSQRQATKDAATIAGIDVVRIINEPTAAALAYGIDKNKNQTVAVFDFGGGTFDITILRIQNGIFDVLSTCGDTNLGGDDFDAAIVKYAVDAFQTQHGFDPTSDRMALQRLLDAAENAKKELSSQPQTEINLPFLAATPSGPMHLVLTLTRTHFEEITQHLVDRLRAPCEQALLDAGVRRDQLDEIVLVGGSTRIPKVREFVRTFFGKEPHKGTNPDEAIAIGAAIHAKMLAGGLEELLLLDVTPLSLGIEAKGGVMCRLIERNTTLPTIHKEIFSTAQDGQREVGIHVLQGEREFASDNRSLGIFWLDGIHPAPAGVPRIEVTFNIDANGILTVSARDLERGTEQSIQIESSSGLTAGEVERMRKQAEQAAEEDRRRRELLDGRNAAEVVEREAQRLLKDGHKRLGEEDRKAIEKSLKNLRETISGDDPGRIPLAIWHLQQALRLCEAKQPRQPKSA